MPTLKQYLEQHGLVVDPDQRSKIGLLLSKENDNNGRVLEDGFMVKDYKPEFLESEHSQLVIISFLKYL